MTEKVLLFIPMYNCQKQVARVLGKICDEEQRFFSEVLVVDNRSLDNSVESAKVALGKLKHVKTTLLQNEANYSLGGSIKVAFNFALQNGYDYVVTLHGDDQGDVRDITPVLRDGVHRDADIVIGARFHKDSKLVGYSKVRTIGNRMFNLLYWSVTGQKIDDMIAGVNIFRVSSLQEKAYLCFPNNLTFDAHLLLYAISQRKKLRFVPITWREEDQVSNAKVFRQGVTILKLLMRYCVLRDRLFVRMHNNDFSRIPYNAQVVYNG